MTVKRRGMRDARTGAGTVGRRDAMKERPLLQFKLGCLELERSRLLAERAAAMRRVAEIDQRCAAIAEQMTQHEGVLDRSRAAASLATGRTVAPGRGLPGAGHREPPRTLRY